ncbi:MAG TPA: 30S ribosomal protein S2 [Bacteroidia bacterium]|nr:30S ribosomal protein S2 [Bacteroidia bacterium]
MALTSFNELLEVGAHFGHMRSKWNPAMAPYIFAEKNGIHIIDLNKTVVKIEESANALKQIARSGKKILFVATKKQAKEIVAEKVKAIGMPYVTERWPGGMLTNFATIRKTVRRMAQIDKMTKDGTFDNISKKERLNISRERAKLETQFGSIAELTRLPSAIFIVDVSKENIAVAEAKKLNIPSFGIVDTNSNPNSVDFAIPANDDASTSIAYILDIICKAVAEGLSERKHDKDVQESEDKEEVLEKDVTSKYAADKVEDEKSPARKGARKRTTTTAKK